MKKKNLRNLLILILLVLTFGISSVNAESFVVGDKYTKDWKRGFTNYQDRNGNNKIIINGLTIPNPINRGLTVIPYEITKIGTNNQILGYCIDPHLQSDTTYKIDYILGASKDKTNNAIGLGVLEIMKHGYSEFDGTPKISTGLSDQNFYVATSIAIRAFSMGIGGQGKGTASNNELIAIASAHVNIGREWLASSSYSNSFSDLVKYNPSWFNNQYKFVYDVSNTTAKEVMDVAKRLFDIGVSKANEVSSGASTTPTITTKTNQGETSVRIELSYENFDASKGVIKNFKLNCASCSNLKVNGETVNANKNYLSGSTGKITITFDVAKQGENCKTTDYKVAYDYNDPNLEYVGAHLIPVGQTNAQNFYVMQRNKDGLTGEISGKIKCNNACDTELEAPICSTNEDDAVATIKAPEKVKTCIIDNQDDAGNTYQFTASAGGVSNSYCNVFCKEDYAKIKLNPIVQAVNCGGYFKLTSHIEGTKTCYTGGNTADKSINKSQFIKDIVAAQRKMIEGYDLVLKAEAASATSAREDTCSSCTGCTGVGYIKVGTYTGIRALNATADGYVGTANSTGSFRYGSAPSCSSSRSTTCDKDGKNCVTSCDGGSCQDGATTASIASAIAADKAHGEKLISEGKSAYEKAMREYNACTTGWINTFLFEQKLRYYYDENHGKDNENYTPYYDLISKDEYKDLQYLEKDGNEEIKTTITICTGQANEAYDCVGNQITLSGDAENTSANSYNYKSSYSSAFASKTFTVCSSSGCSRDTQNISQATFVKKEVEKKQDYVTPTAFYQIAANGKVTVNSGYTGNKVQLEALLNSLPVSTSTVGGGVVRLMIEDLGEFYDEKNGVGRLIDYNGDREENSVAAVVKVNSFDGNYKCYYESPCRPKDCPNCTFECVGDGCEWTPCTGPSCDNKCPACIINLDELNIIHRTISTTNFHSANRSYGYNWITTSNLANLQLLTKKAEKTISEIEEVNEMVYDKTGNDSELAFSIKMTPEVINTIKEYNKNHTNDGGYINDSLTCYDATIDGQTYKNIYCYSDLIDELVDKYGDAITATNRVENNETKRKNETESSGYWTLWSGYVYNESVLGGPSWK